MIYVRKGLYFHLERHVHNPTTMGTSEDSKVKFSKVQFIFHFILSSSVRVGDVLLKFRYYGVDVAPRCDTRTKRLTRKLSENDSHNGLLIFNFVLKANLFVGA